MAKLRTTAPEEDPMCNYKFNWREQVMKPGESWSNCGGEFCKDN